MSIACLMGHLIHLVLHRSFEGFQIQESCGYAVHIDHTNVIHKYLSMQLIFGLVILGQHAFSGLIYYQPINLLAQRGIFLVA